MKNLNSNFVLNLLFLFTGLLWISCSNLKNSSVSDPSLTIRYSENEKTHSRAIMGSEKELIIAASDGKVYFYPKESKSIYSMFSDSKREYRDVIFKENKIVIMAIGDSSEVTSYKIEKSDKIFKTPFQNVFLDGMDYVDNTIFMMGDPVNNKFSLYTSTNWGESWDVIENSPFAFNGEAGFAASGTNVKMLGTSIYSFVSGGDSSRYFRTNDAGKTWFSKSMGFNSCSTCGAYSFTILKNGKIIAVGGDYLQPDQSKGTCRMSKDGGLTWFSPKIGPSGYRSNVTEINGILYSCGTNGIDFSRNKGKTWKVFSKGNYFTLCKFDNMLAASTTKGTIHLFKLIK